MRLEFYENRAAQVFNILQKLWQTHESVFSGIVLPQDRFGLPSDPIEKANTLLFMAITQRGGVVSEDPVKYIAALRGKYPDLFNPHAVVNHWPASRIEETLRKFAADLRRKREKATITKQLTLFEADKATQKKQQENGLYKAGEFARSWRQNAETLAKRWDGNVLNMFDGISDFEGFFARADYKQNKQGLHGMRRKILSLFTIWLQEKDLVQAFPTPIPVDFHAMRLLFATGIVVAHDIDPFRIREGTHPEHFAGRKLIRVTEDMMDLIALWSQPFMVAHKFSHLAINPALWVLSRELCVHELQNQARGRGRHWGNGRAMTLTYAEDLELNHGLWPFPYNDPAIHCPLADMCTKVFPSAPYYAFGLLAQDRRVPFPHRRLPVWIKPNSYNCKTKNDRT